MNRRTLFFALVSSLCVCTRDAYAQPDPRTRPGNEPVEPFRLIDNIYYVGASGVTAFLITTPAGHFLTDGGYDTTAPQILANIRRLGFKPEDVRVLLNSHAHSDHAGGLAALKKATGARLYAAPGDAPLLRSGGRGDFRFGESLLFPPVEPDQLLKDGQVLELGGKAITLHLTPGHTRGCTSWSTRVQDGKVPRSVLFICSTSILDYRFVGQESYPGIKADFERTFTRLRARPCEVLLAPHAEFFQLQTRRVRGGTSGKNPFVDPAACRAYINQQQQAFRRALERQ